MRLISGETYQGSLGYHARCEVSDVIYDSCEFRGGSIGSDDLARMASVRRVTIRRCKAHGFGVYRAVFDDVLIESLQTPNMVMMDGTLFRRTVFRGRVGRMIINRGRFPNGNTDPEWAAYAREFYTHTDWALDISQAEFSDGTIRSIPVDLIRRDAETQAILRRETIDRLGWDSRVVRGVMERDALSRVYLEELPLLRLDDTLIVAPRANKKMFAKTMQSIAILRDAGLAE